MASAGGATELADLFRRHERLSALLAAGKSGPAEGSSGGDGGGGGAAAAPGLVLVGCTDAVGEAVRAAGRAAAEGGSGGGGGGGGEVLRPTVTYAVGAPHPRAYKSKRTPSWTDRILARDLDLLRINPLDAAGGGAGGGTVARLVAGPVACHSLPRVVCSDHEAVVAVWPLRPVGGSHS